MEEPLLKLHRKYTDKEKLAWSKQTLSKQQKEIEILSTENFNLKAKNLQLSEKIKADEIQYGKLNGQDFISVKAYLKLQARYKYMEKTFWEKCEELNSIKNKNEKL